MACPSPDTSLFDPDPISELPELSNRESSEESDTADDTVDDTERETFYTPIPDYIKSPRLRDTRHDFFQAIVRWGQEESFGVFIERSQKKNGEERRVELRCDRANRRPRRGYCRKTSSSKTAANCPWKVVLVRKKSDNNKWSFTAKNLHHEDHGRSGHWQQHRALRSYHTPEQTAWFEERYQILKPRQLCVLWEKEFEEPIRRRDVYNWIARLRRQERSGYTDTQFFVRELEIDDTVNWYALDTISSEDNTETFRHCAWSFTTQRDIWRTFPDCISIDATYRTNYLHWALVIVVITTPERTSMPVFQALLSNEGDNGYQWLGRCLQNYLDRMVIGAPGVVITDGDAQLVRALGIYFPHTQLQRCIFHKAKNIIDYIKKNWIRPRIRQILTENENEVAAWSEAIHKVHAEVRLEDHQLEADTDLANEADERQLTTSRAVLHQTANRRLYPNKIPEKVAETRSGLYLLWESMAYSKTEEDYKGAWSLINSQFGITQKKIVDYLKAEDQLRSQWAGYCIRQYQNFGARTTSPNESSNGSIKSYGLSARSSLTEILTTSKEFTNRCFTTYSENLNLSSERVVLQYFDMEWLGKSALILTRYALDLLVEQHQKMLGEVASKNSKKQLFARQLPPCTNSFRRQYGLPCAHEMLVRYQENQAVLVYPDEAHPFWHLQQRLVSLLLVPTVSVLTESMYSKTEIDIFASRCHR